MGSRPSVVALALAASAVLVAPARADDPPHARGIVPKISNALLEGLVGSWDVAWSGMGHTGAGTSRVRKVAGGTALLQETRVRVMEKDYDAVAVFRLDDEGKTVKLWRFDTLHPVEITAYRGPITADAFDLSTEGGAGLRMRKTDAGYEATLATGGSVVFTSTYTKSSKAVEFDAPNAPKDGPRPGMIGTWDVTGEWSAGVDKPMKLSGTSTFRWTLGGAMIVHEYERTTPMGPVSSIGLHRGPADASIEKVWWFADESVDPMLAQGPVEGDAWHGQGTSPEGVPLGLEWSKKPDGTYQMRYTLAKQPAGVETYTKRK